MSLINLFTLSYFGMMVNKETIGVCVFLISCRARQCSPLRRYFMGCSINNPALSLLMKHLVIGQR